MPIKTIDLLKTKPPDRATIMLAFSGLSSLFYIESTEPLFLLLVDVNETLGKETDPFFQKTENFPPDASLPNFSCSERIKSPSEQKSDKRKMFAYDFFHRHQTLLDSAQCS